MISITPTSLVTSALRLLGIYVLGQPPQAIQIMQGVEVVNQIIDNWATQELTIPSVTREVFPLIVGQQTYTIGEGGNFNTARPQSIDGAAMLINPASVLSVTSITRSGSTATVTVTAHGYSTGANILIAGATQTAYNGTFIVTVTGANTFTYTVTGTPTTPATGTKTCQDAIGQAYEIPIELLSYEQYIGIAMKGVTSPYPYVGFYNTTTAGGLGSFFLWPIPNAAAKVVLYCGKPLTQFDTASLSAAVLLAPGYAKALRYNLAMELLPEYPRPDNAQIARIERTAVTALADIKRQNDRPALLDVSDVAPFSGWPGSNIYTGP